jgi:putative transferase (TIGR04331 family)
MLLVTTADERTWGTGARVLFLGEWCKLFERHPRWSSLEYEVLPYHWDDPEELHRDHTYLVGLYEEVLTELVPELNKLHDVQHSARYWRMIIGLWLLGFIHVLFDRYRSIAGVVEDGRANTTLLLRPNCRENVPLDFAEFSTLSTECDRYNHYLYGQIIKRVGSISVETMEVSEEVSEGSAYTSFRSGRTPVLRRLTRALLGGTPKRLSPIVLVDTGRSATDLIRLQLALGQPPYVPNPGKAIPRPQVALEVRKRIRVQGASGGFGELLRRMIPEQIPTLYVEGYAETCAISAEAYPSRPKAILNSVAYNANEMFKFWAAEHMDRGVKLLGSQHGGMYGTGMLSAPEDHQVAIYDMFYSWGWKSAEHKNVRPMPAIKLNAGRGMTQALKSGRLLLVQMAIARYAYIPEMLCTSASGYLAYLDEQFRFARALSAENRKLLLVRQFVHDYGWSQADRWAAELPEVECSDASQSLGTELNLSRLAICTYNATTCLETFAANVPTILFWDRDRWEVRASAKPYYDQLRHVGILHDTPEGAASKVNEIAGDTSSWWHLPEVQDAKDRFCAQFAWTSENWVEQWSSELRRQAGR